MLIKSHDYPEFGVITCYCIDMMLLFRKYDNDLVERIWKRLPYFGNWCSINKYQLASIPNTERIYNDYINNVIDEINRIIDSEKLYICIYSRHKRLRNR